MHAQQRALDSIIQSSAVNLFGGAGLTVAPFQRTTSVPEDLECSMGANVSFRGEKVNGELSLLFSKGALELVRGLDSSSVRAADWACEMANQLLGRVRNRLAFYGVDVNSGLPSLLTGSLLARKQSSLQPEAVYRFRSLRGEVVVILEGKIDYGALEYVGGAEVANEGDVILF